MGIISDTLGLVRTTQEDLDRQISGLELDRRVVKEQLITTRIGMLGIDGEMEVTGELDVALIHCFGKGAFDPESTRIFTNFAGNVAHAASREDDEGAPGVPMLIIGRTDNKTGMPSESSLAIVQPNNVRFSSTKTPTGNPEEALETASVAPITSVLGLSAPVAIVRTRLDKAAEFNEQAAGDITLESMLWIYRAWHLIRGNGLEKLVPSSTMSRLEAHDTAIFYGWGGVCGSVAENEWCGETYVEKVLRFRRVEVLRKMFEALGIMCEQVEAAEPELGELFAEAQTTLARVREV